MRIRQRKSPYRHNRKRIHLALYALPLIFPIWLFSARYLYQKGAEGHVYDNEPVDGIVTGIYYQEAGAKTFAALSLIIELDNHQVCAVPGNYFKLFRRSRAELMHFVTPGSKISLVINRYRPLGFIWKKARVVQIVYNGACYLSVDDVLEYEQRERNLWDKISPFLLIIVIVIILELCMHQFIMGWNRAKKQGYC